MADGLAMKVAETTRNLSLTHEELAAIAGTSTRSVARYLAGEVIPHRLTRQRLLELAYVAEQLTTVLRPDAANLWLHSPNRLLDHDTPAAKIQQGDYRRVLALIEALADGIVV
jgi:transcriptional regulator with XRE-family HTH domain